MRFNIPLLPMQVSIERRTLPPFRFTIRATMLVVGIMAVFFTSMNHMGHLGRLNRYHADRITPNGSDKQYHIDMTNQYAIAIQQADTLVALFAATILILLVIAVVGRLLNRPLRRE